MTKHDSKSPEIKFKFIFADDYNPVYANGIYGGVTPQGEIVANFFFDRHALPISQSYSITQAGQLGELTTSEPNDLKKSVVRFVANGVILNIRTAKEFHNWLGEQIKLVEEAERENKS